MSHPIKSWIAATIITLLLASINVILIYSLLSAGRGLSFHIYAKDTIFKPQVAKQKDISAQRTFPGEEELDKRVRYRKFIQGDPTQNKIAITFDDGPHPAYTPKILKILRTYGVKATFFVVGQRAAQYPWLVKQEFDEGHTIGNHTYHHLDMTEIPSDEAQEEITDCEKIIFKITGKKPYLFRPPGGDYDKESIDIANHLGYTVVLWTDNSGDSGNMGNTTVNIKRRVFGRISNGGIILFHDGIKNTIDLLPQMLLSLKTMGYSFTTIDKMIKYKPR